MTGRRVVVRVPEVLEPDEVWARPAADAGVSPGELEWALRRLAELREEPLVPEPVVSKTIPWVLIAIALVIALYAVYAAWHSLHGPDLVRVRSHPVDLVGPHR
jgi:hypothetical protein